MTLLDIREILIRDTSPGARELLDTIGGLLTCKGTTLEHNTVRSICSLFCNPDWRVSPITDHACWTYLAAYFIKHGMYKSLLETLPCIIDRIGNRFELRQERIIALMGCGIREEAREQTSALERSLPIAASQSLSKQQYDELCGIVCLTTRPYVQLSIAYTWHVVAGIWFRMGYADRCLTALKLSTDLLEAIKETRFANTDRHQLTRRNSILSAACYAEKGHSISVCLSDIRRLMDSEPAPIGFVNRLHDNFLADTLYIGGLLCEACDYPEQASRIYDMVIQAHQQDILFHRYVSRATAYMQHLRSQ